MIPLIYDTGTVTVEHGSAEVTGNLTGWQVALIRYGLLAVEAPGGNPMVIVDVASDTSLTAATKWQGPSGTYAYAIYLNSDNAGSAVWTNRLLADILKRGSLWSITPTWSGDLDDRDALDLDMEDAGQYFGYVEAGHDAVLYLWTGTAWSDPIEIKGGDGEDGDDGAPGAAYEQYGITVYDDAGIAPGQWDADIYASANNVQDTLYAEIRGGDPNSEADILIMVAGVGVYGPVRVAYGAPVVESDIGVVIAKGVRVGVAVSYVSGTVIDLAVKTSGAVA